MRVAGWISVSLVTALGLSCAHSSAGRAEADDSAVRAAIKKGNDAIIAAVKRGDAAAVAQIFTEDADFIPVPPGKGFISGRAAIEALNAQRLQKRRYLDLVLSTTSVGTSGDLAYETGTNSVTFQEGDAAPVTRTGRYLVVWRRDPDGVWRIRVDLPIADPPP
jgi:uncharacterized protein (TIGR02246 family)